MPRIKSDILRNPRTGAVHTTRGGRQHGLTVPPNIETVPTTKRALKPDSPRRAENQVLIQAGLLNSKGKPRGPARYF